MNDTEMKKAELKERDNVCFQETRIGLSQREPESSVRC